MECDYSRDEGASSIEKDSEMPCVGIPNQRRRDAIRMIKTVTTVQHFVGSRLAIALKKYGFRGWFQNFNSFLNCSRFGIEICSHLAEFFLNLGSGTIATASFISRTCPSVNSSWVASSPVINVGIKTAALKGSSVTCFQEGHD